MRPTATRAVLVDSSPQDLQNLTYPIPQLRPCAALETQSVVVQAIQRLSSYLVSAFPNR